MATRKALDNSRDCYGERFFFERYPLQLNKSVDFTRESLMRIYCLEALLETPTIS